MISRVQSPPDDKQKTQSDSVTICWWLVERGREGGIYDFSNQLRERFIIFASAKVWTESRVGIRFRVQTESETPFLDPFNEPPLLFGLIYCLNCKFFKN